MKKERKKERKEGRKKERKKERKEGRKKERKKERSLFTEGTTVIAEIYTILTTLNTSI
jgi:hypothetical protein